jgi:hypothetical protein
MNVPQSQMIVPGIGPMGVLWKKATIQYHLWSFAFRFISDPQTIHMSEKSPSIRLNVRFDRHVPTETCCRHMSETMQLLLW